MTLVSDHTSGLQRHVTELLRTGHLTANEAGRLRDRIRALEGDITDAYDRPEQEAE